MFRYGDVDDEVNDLGTLIIQVAIGLQRDLGPGMLERPYKLGLAQRLANLGHHVRIDLPVELEIEGLGPEHAYEPDIVVDDTIAVEVKSGADIHIRHIMQTKTYLRSGGWPLGYVLNFGPPRLGIKRVVP